MACWNEAAALGLMDLADALRADERLPAEVREFVIMRTAFRCGASLPVAHHSAAARSLAVPEWLIEAAIGRAQLPLDDGFGDVAAVVDSLVADKQAEPEAFERLQARLGPALALDIVMLTGLYITVSLVMNACAITCEDKD
ncbi:carboxymuconolactone decarboxylase family protein [Novosphingobium pentaromativorans]|uniref:Carboxymuconolactone decarboxylase-like domain-containing protein n=2 Tax=Novosphingobium pentaromativorans TaxID=205844 RepID=G6EGQ6_9SPHN|nr:hypothetical protein [Novosphingobium pentaromativorans]EHJ59499.1 hypothetical protein NSU_3527 [Novosphingobium pentaromativorans US6-1]